MRIFSPHILVAYAQMLQEAQGSDMVSFLSGAAKRAAVQRRRAQQETAQAYYKYKC